MGSLKESLFSTQRAGLNKCVRKHFVNRNLLTGEIFFERTDWYAPTVGLAKRITKQQVGTKGRTTVIETEMLLRKVEQ